MTNESAERVESPWNLAALRQSDEAEVRKFIEYLFPRLYARVRVLGFPHDEAEDIVQNVFIMLLNSDRLAKIESSSHLSAYAYVLVRNAALHQLKRTRSMRKLESDMTLQVPPTTEHPEPGSDISLRISLEKALGELDQEERRIVALRFVEDRSVSEIADMIGSSRMVVRSRLSRALGHLRGILLAPEMTGEGNDF